MSVWTSFSSHLRPMKRLKNGGQRVFFFSFFGSKPGGFGRARYSLNVEDGVGRVGSRLLFGGISDQTLLIGVGDVGRGDTVSLIVDENFDLALLHDTNARVGGAEILSGARGSAGWSGSGAVRDRGRGRGRGQKGREMSTYNTNDGAILGNFVSLNALDESQRREKKADPGDHAEAQGPRALVVSQHGEGRRGVARTIVKQRRGQQNGDGK